MFLKELNHKIYMARKGLSTTLVLIVTVVVLLIVALVLLTVFGMSISQIASVSEGKTQCGIVFGAFCTGSSDTRPSPPPTWGAELFSLNGVKMSCEGICEGWASSCDKGSGDTYVLQC
jgi:H+/gluconate symporter-like permease